MRSLSLLSALFLAGCTSTIPWSIDSISAGNVAYDSAKLIAVELETRNPLNFEFIRSNGEITSYLSLKQFWFHRETNTTPTVKAEFKIGSKKFVEELALLEGNMRLKLSSQTTDLLIASLQQGEKVVILIDGFEKSLNPEEFSKIYDKWMGSAAFLRNPLKGPS